MIIPFLQYFMRTGAARVALGADLPAVFSNNISTLMVNYLFFKITFLSSKYETSFIYFSSTYLCY